LRNFARRLLLEITNKHETVNDSASDTVRGRAWNLEMIGYAKRRWRAALILCAALTLIIAVVVLVLFSQGAAVQAPTVSVAEFSSIGSIDGSEREMVYVSLCFSNALRPKSRIADTVFVRNLTANDGSGSHEVFGPPTFQVQYNPATRQFLVPADGHRLRISFEYTGARVRDGWSAYIAERLPLAIRRRLPATFWRRAGWVKFGPAKNWKPATIELPMGTFAKTERRE
jgi:hypothetical protein